jgi:hypothetical protein
MKIFQKIPFIYFVLVCSFAQAQSLLPVKINKKWGFIDTLGQLIVEPKYQQVGEFYTNYSTVCQESNCGVINKNGELVVPINYRSIDCFDDSIFVVETSDHLYGIYNSKGEFPYFFNQIRLVNNAKNELLINSNELNFSLLYRNGRLDTLPMKTTSIIKMDKYYLVQLGSNNQLLDHKLNLYDRFSFQTINIVKDGVFILSKNNKYALAKENELLLPFDYTKIELKSVESPYFEVTNGVKTGLYDDKKRSFFLPVEFLDIKLDPIFSSRIYKARNRNNQVLVVNQFNDTLGQSPTDDCWVMSEEMIRYKVQNHYKISSIRNGVLIGEFADVSEVLSGFCMVKANGLSGLVNENGKLVLPAIYAYFEKSGDNLKAVKPSNETDLFQILPNFTLEKRQSFKKFVTLQIGGGEQEVDEDFSRFEFRKVSETFDKKADSIANELAFLRYEAVKGQKHYFLYDNKTKRKLTEELFNFVEVEKLNKGAKMTRCIFPSGRMGLVDKAGNIKANAEMKLSPNNPKTAVKAFCYLSEPQENGLRIYSVNQILNNKGVPPVELLKVDSYLKSALSEGSWGILDENNELLIQPFFRKIKKISNGKLIAQNSSGFWGVIELNGDTVLPFEFKEINEISANEKTYYTVIKAHPYWAVFDQNGNASTKADFKEIDNYSQGVSEVKIGLKFTAVDTLGKVFSDPVYERVGLFSDGVLPVRKQNLWGLINTDGDTVLDFKYKSLGTYQKGVLAAKKDRKYGLINLNGDWQSKQNFTRIYENHNGYLIAKKNSHYGLIDVKGNWVLRNHFKTLEFYGENYLKGRNMFGKSTLYSIKNEKVVIWWAKKIQTTKNENYFVVYKAKKLCLIDSLGNKITDFGQYNEIKYLGENKFAGLKNSQWKIFDQNGRILCNNESYRNVYLVAQNLAVVNKEFDKWFLIDTNGYVVANSSKKIEYIAGLFLLNGKDFVNSNGLAQFSTSLNAAMPNTPNLIIAQKIVSFTKKKNRSGVVDIPNFAFQLINKHGFYLTEANYDQYKELGDGYFALRTKNYAGLVSENFEQIIAPSFENYKVLENGFIKVSNGGSCGYFDLKTNHWIWKL